MKDDKKEFVKQQLNRNIQQSGGRMSKSEQNKHEKVTKEFWNKYNKLLKEDT